MFTLKLSAKIEVIAAAGIEARIITEFATMDLSFINIDIKYKTVGIMISLTAVPYYTVQSNRCSFMFTLYDSAPTIIMDSGPVIFPIEFALAEITAGSLTSNIIINIPI